MNIKDNNEKWYFKNSFIFSFLCFLSLFPFGAIWAIPILYYKNKNTDKILINAQLEIDSEVSKAKALAEKIILEAKETAIKIENKHLEKLNELELKINNREEIMQNIIDAAQIEATEKLHNINSEIANKDLYFNEVNSLKQEIEIIDKQLLSKRDKLSQLTSIQKSVNNAIKKYFKNEPLYDQQLILPAEVINEINTFGPSVILRLHSMDYKDLRKAYKANEKLIINLLERYESRYLNKTNKAIYQLMVIALRSELQNILFTLTYSKLDDAVNLVKEIINKYLNIARDGNQTISSTLAKFIGELEPLFIDAVKIEYEYYIKKEAAKQEQLALREQMRQEAEERKLLEQQREQIEKEESKYKTEIENITIQLKESDDDEKTQSLLNKIKELEMQLSEVEHKKEDIVNLQNGKAGYVYIISNLGSFGDDIFKVGMTRRLNPQDRVDELGDASVPFRFDVHSFIFSDDAVQLESALHAELEKNRLNKINLRKEFFKISIDELESLVDKVDSTAEFRKTMIAEQYRQSLSLDYLTVD